MARQHPTDVKRAVDELVSLAGKQGFVTTDDVAAALPTGESGPDEQSVDELYTLLAQAGVEPREVGLDDVASAALTLEELTRGMDRGTALDFIVDSDDTISIYLREIGSIPLLTGEEETTLAKAYEAGRAAEYALHDPEELAELDPERELMLERQVERGLRARDRLIRSNFRLVVHMAKRYTHHTVALLDLIQEGNVGLIRAVEKFDYRRGFKFSTYATWWIKQAITRALADQARTIRVPVHVTEQIGKLMAASRKLEQTLGREPTPAELARELGVTEHRVNEIREIAQAQRTISLDVKVGDDSDSELMEFIPDNDTPELYEQAGRGLLREELELALGTLTPREQEVIELRYGLADGTPHTLEEVGEKFGVTRERIRQIETKAIRRLRHPARSKKLRDYLR
jgi:RNA polymerase primary sigma factor